MHRTLAVIVLLAVGLICPRCRMLHGRPGNLPSSAVLVGSTYINCTVDKLANKYHCTVYKDVSGEILADGIFVISPRGAGSDDQAELLYSGYRDRFILLKDSRALVLEEPSELDPSNQIIAERLKSLSSKAGGTVIDCGRTPTSGPDNRVSECGENTFQNRKPFHVRYYQPEPLAYFSYGLAGDASGNVSAVLYDIRGLPSVASAKNAQLLDDNHTRVTPCIRPVTLGKTEEGLLACIIPVNEKASAIAAQQKPIEATVCAVAENPAAFNNRMVRIAAASQEILNIRCWVAMGALIRFGLLTELTHHRQGWSHTSLAKAFREPRIPKESGFCPFR